MRFPAAHSIFKSQGELGMRYSGVARLRHCDRQQGKAYWTLAYAPGTQTMATEQTLVTSATFEEK
jgi:hypothetical protein